ncbi:unnamed protein product [Clonostachys rosea f. rosea IK726]|uniref:Uncharacterized protein n=1 Tax=Clonostachys rosea f. rosea IK726 TaxID=1349383 RepID=A0ACA9TNR8_BIOOC|nr:unnamed protein product [Clonostachys rosea f. rosea IK726]
MTFTIKIKNQYQPGTSRCYCVAAQPPLVKDEKNINVLPGERGLMTPAFTVTDSLTHGSVISVTFQYEYFAFVGIRKSENSHHKIELTKSVPISLGSGNENGSVVLVDWTNNYIDINLAEQKDLEEHQLKLAPKDAIRIKCHGSPNASNNTKYVVGLAQRLVTGDDSANGGEDPVPVTAVAYKSDKLYTIWPSAIMVVNAVDSTTLEGHILPSSTQMVPVDLSRVKKNKSPQISLVENSKDFYPRGSKQQQPPLRKQAAPPKWKEEADKLGFTYFRQLHAYKFLTKYNATQLASYHSDEQIKSIAKNAKIWGDKIRAKDGYSDEYLDDLLVLALFDTILFLDNSWSMNDSNEPTEELQDIAGSIVEVESIYDNTPSVRIEFLNGKPRDDTAETADEVRELIANINNFGTTPLGAQLRKKILDRFVYPKLQAKGTFRPVLICVITDGCPDPAEKGRFQNEIDECKKLLMDRDRTKVGEKHVLFQISRVGKLREAEQFIKSLKADPELKNILHVTSYQQLNFTDDDSNDPIFTYSAAISRLAGAALLGLKRDENGELVFPVSQ